MVNFELGNPETVREIGQGKHGFGKFVFKRTGDDFGLYVAEYASHPALVEELRLLKKGELSESIWGGGSFLLDDYQLEFSGSSGYYGKVPNSFLIACCRDLKLLDFFPSVGGLSIGLARYFEDDPQLEDRRKTWRDLGGFELDTQRKEYVFDREMDLVEERVLED